MMEVPHEWGSTRRQPGTPSSTPKSGSALTIGKRQQQQQQQQQQQKANDDVDDDDVDNEDDTHIDHGGADCDEADNGAAASSGNGNAKKKAGATAGARKRGGAAAAAASSQGQQHPTKKAKMTAAAATNAATAAGAADAGNNNTVIPTAVEGEGAAGNNNNNGGQQQQQQQAQHIAEGALGPRGLFDVSVQEAPVRGQLKQAVLRHLSVDSDTPLRLENDIIDVDCLICKLPYKKMLSELFGGHERRESPSSASTVSAGGSLTSTPSASNSNMMMMMSPRANNCAMAPQIPYVTRIYEESFMRENMHPGERKCARGKQCECMVIDAEQPFIGVEFLLPSERPPPTPHLCVLCCRAVTQQLYFDVMFDKQEFGGVIQRFGNIHGEPGEYALDSMLIAAPTAPVHIMPLPIVSHQRNRYTVFVQNGIKHLKQSRVYFQITPSC